MKGIQAGAYLHLFDFVNGLAVGEDDTALVQRRSAVREQVLYYEVLAFLCINKGSDISILGSDNGL